MVQEDLLIRVVGRLNQLVIPYMMTGGIAAIFHGKPRLTHDFDVVVEIETEDIPKLINAFKGEFYIDEESIHEAVENRSMFNLIHTDSGIKVNFWLVRDNDFDRKRFERRERHTYSGREIFFSTPEDIILIKLIWYKEIGFVRRECEKYFIDSGIKKCIDKEE